MSGYAFDLQLFIVRVRASTHPETAPASGNTGFPYGGFSWAATGNFSPRCIYVK